MFMSSQNILANEYMTKLRASIDHALAVSYRKDPVRDRPMYVARITLTTVSYTHLTLPTMAVV